MLTYPEIDPVLVSLGPLKVHWYGAMYALAFILGWWFATHRAKQPNSGWNTEEISDFVFFVALGVILGGRVGYVLFYNFPEFIANPLMLFKVWQGGMSFHGGVLGVMLAMYFYGRKTNRPFLAVLDYVGPFIPAGLFTGRVGNFINAELWGKPTDLPWGMVFPNGGPLPRHPSMLYEAFLEGIVLFVVLWLFSSKSRPLGAISGLGLMLYGVFRFLVEFVRIPDDHLGYLAFNWLTMGQILCVPMIIGGAWLLWRAYQSPKTVSRQVK